MATCTECTHDHILHVCLWDTGAYFGLLTQEFTITTPSLDSHLGKTLITISNTKSLDFHCVRQCASFFSPTGPTVFLARVHH